MPFFRRESERPDVATKCAAARVVRPIMPALLGVCYYDHPRLLVRGGQTTVMSFQCAQRKQLTTREAAVLTGRTQDAVKAAIRRGELPGKREMDGWRVTPEDLLAWNARTRRSTRSSSRPWERAAELLAQYGSLSPQEITPLLDRHPGNARKSWRSSTPKAEPNGSPMVNGS